MSNPLPPKKLTNDSFVMRVAGKQVCECHNYCGDDERVKWGTHMCCKNDRDFPVDSNGKNLLEQAEAELTELREFKKRVMELQPSVTVTSKSEYWHNGRDIGDYYDLKELK